MYNNWHIISEKKEMVNNLSNSLNVSNIIAHLLVARGINSYEQAKLFFRPEVDKLHSPFLMKDMESAVERIINAIAKKEKILIYGDYDVDGTTAVSMMFLFLKTFNSNIEYYIPCRYKEGYGLSFQGISFALENQFSLIISLDCGITAIDQVNFANQNTQIAPLFIVNLLWYPAFENLFTIIRRKFSSKSKAKTIRKIIPRIRFNI